MQISDPGTLAENEGYYDDVILSSSFESCNDYKINNELYGFNWINPS